MNRSAPWLAFVLAAALSGSALLEGMAFAGPATDTVKAKQTTLFERIRARDDAGVLAILDEMLDYDSIAKASLGEQWAARTDAERAEFQRVLKALVQQAYKKNLQRIVDSDVAYVSESSSGDVTSVTTKARSRADVTEDPIEITFSLRGEASGPMRVVDISTEGVSLVGTYRSQFTKIVKKDGFAVLLQKMKDKLAAG